ncbi:unnamed protein product [Cyprideis torosa]|uniref:Uncharacterized protein n=1 Tax=Cyprideis torosa TaxID=163714 RepID=A0A7R8ZGR1_9CRUS|nr:unnamed protein product [Cyprideis torosa]CAG0880826.1 unnamed protein product [Cyprideis torosa]
MREYIGKELVWCYRSQYIRAAPDSYCLYLCVVAADARLAFGAGDSGLTPLAENWEEARSMAAGVTDLPSRPVGGAIS